jgi:plastocyanin
MRVVWKRALVAAVLLGSVLAAIQAAGPGDATAVQQSVWVSMADDWFWPDVIVVPAGTTVVWSNDEGDPNNAHNVVAADDSFRSEDIWPGQVWELTFWWPGVYDYYCDLHEGMYGQVIVE